MADYRSAGGAFAAGLVLVGGVFVALVTGLIEADELFKPALALGGAALLLVAVRAARQTFVRMPEREPRRTAFPAHSFARIQASIDECAAHPRPDVVTLLDYLIHQASMVQSSDIHCVPYREFVALRYRVDGIMTDVARIPVSLREAAVNRLKVLSGAVTYVHDRPQDGRFDLQVGARRIDVRIAFMPTLHGERVVMRVLDRAEVELGLGGLGFGDAQLARLTDIVCRPQGMLILTGPTGSGKTTTIYCALRAIHQRDQQSSSIYTLEDPIEYDLMNINQTQIEETQGLTFASGLRTMLRQDPDVIMVGEIRDLETARIAVQAGMTGHLIITTVHANQASGVFARLIEMGVDAHSAAAAVTAIVAQRLLRLLCPHCKRPAPATPGQEAKLGRPLPGRAFFEAVGCAKCNLKGYLGRRGVFELFEVDEAVRPLIVSRASPEALQRAAIARGMATLAENGLLLAERGETSLDEVIRILPVAERAA